MNKRRTLYPLLSGLVAVGSVGSSAVAPVTASTASTTQVRWHECPTYSDEVLGGILEQEQIATFQAQWARTECGEVTVPLDYDDHDGQTITVAFTRLPATDSANRKGSIAFNPGGPGAGGYLMPTLLTSDVTENAQLNENYDLIGFDPRGVGYSTTVDCENPWGPPPPMGNGQVSKAAARQAYEETVEANSDCVRQDPDFLQQITTANVARDLDRIRAALGDQTINFYGGSWGTWLGAVYRTEFSQHAGRFWLDSPVPPALDLNRMQGDGVDAADRNLQRLAKWIAKHDDEYGFGKSRKKVVTALTELAEALDENPRNFIDIPEPLDGYHLAVLTSQATPDWPLVARALQELRDTTGGKAPPAVQRAFGMPPMGPPGDGAPELFNPTMAQAALCNEDTGIRDFESWWTTYQERLTNHPIAGRLNDVRPPCAGWTLPVQTPQLGWSDSPLVLSGHRYEDVTPYEWAGQMRSVIGGILHTVRDDLHGAVFDVPECAAKAREFFATGKVSRQCSGFPEPTTTDWETTESTGPAGLDPDFRTSYFTTGAWN